MENIENTAVDTKLESLREQAERIISHLEMQIGILKDTLIAPKASAEEKEAAAIELEKLNAELSEVTLDKAQLDQNYSADLATRLDEIEASFNKEVEIAAPVIADYEQAA